MRTILLIIISAILLVSCGDRHPKQAAVSLPNFRTTPYFYVQLKGTLAGKNITMQLTKGNPAMYRGYYSYEESGEPIAIWGNLDQNNMLVLYESTDEKEERFFTGILDSAGVYKGKWRGRGTTYEYTLTANMKDATPLTVYYGEDSLKLFPANPNTPEAVATNAILWPAPGLDDATAAFIRNTVTGNPIFDNPVRYLRRDIDSFLVTYKTTETDIDTTQEIPATASWSADADMKVVYNHYPYLCIESFTYEYTGGAHGNYGSIYKVLDLSKKKVLTTDDLFKPGYKEALPALLEKAYRKIFRVSEEVSLKDQLLVDKIPVNENFFITDKGIGFCYTPYEIGPYAMGQVNLFVPFTELKAYLK
ncbi:DUF3298 and DUF4163 domain-containing protein [Chitinophaga silvisoli]|uniref:DUF3298/DUF4163 domain-containing protein n=1 Tax=Chitinophaga silvisoli TaxID=2291814 RepID=A0A3E1P660_9BACT|nr:DUF3298 and DUF4163 domain-containing protein [Chitinophaga silvisoli]RFM35683.1 DUF3298/DUF4163 domain-containing protein [Chitinophaga silvisoli]